MRYHPAFDPGGVGSRRPLPMRPRLVPILVVALAPALVHAGPIDEARSLLRRLASTPGVTGHEGAVRDTIRKELPGWARPEVDNLGNLTVSVGTGSPHLLLVAHMDEPGYVVSGITDGGYLKLQRLSRVTVTPLFDQLHLGQPVTLATRRGPVPGVTVIYSTHLWRGNESPIRKPVLDEDLFVDIGARSPRQVEEAGVALLDPLAIARRIVDLAEGKIAGPAMDDRAGCAALLHLLQVLEPVKVRGTLTVAFTTQNVMGGRGAARLAARLRPDDVLVVDPPLPVAGAPARPDRGVPGNGPVVGIPGTGEGFSQDLYNRVAGHASRAKLSLQNALYASSGDGRPFAAQARVLPLGVPVFYPGTPGEVVDVDDLLSLSRLLKSIAEADR
jgi:putative aminopeptidase